MKRVAAVVLALSVATRAFADPVLPGTLDVTTSDGVGTISIDGARADEGAYHGAIAPGDHEVTVTRPGYQTYRKKITVDAGKGLVLEVSLLRSEALAPPPPPTPAIEGVYGGLFLAPSFEPTHAGNTLEQSCTLLGAVSCDTSAPVGATIAGHLGYTWDPVGLEAFFGGGADYASPQASFDGVVKPGSNPALTGIARTESFRIARVGVMAALRARAFVQNKLFRATFSLGPGLAWRTFIADRTATSSDGLFTDVYALPSTSYFAPALSFEAAAQLRLSPKTALAIGLSMWLENATTQATAQGDPNRTIGPGVALRTPDYRLATGTQFFLWPYIGLELGP